MMSWIWWNTINVIFLLFYSLIPFLKKLIEFIVLFLYMYSGLKFFFLLHMFFNIIYSILVALGLRCGTGFLAAVASLTVERGLKACRLGCGGLSHCGAQLHTGLLALQHVGRSWTRDWTLALAGGFLYHCTIREVPYSFLDHLVSGLVVIAFAWLGTVFIPSSFGAAAAAAAKSLQSCPTLCDPRDGSPPGSPVPGILQARTMEWVAISFSSAWKWKVKVKSLSRVWLLATPWTAAYQAPASMEFSRQEYWSGVPLPSPALEQRSSCIWLLGVGEWVGEDRGA